MLLAFYQFEKKGIGDRFIVLTKCGARLKNQSAFLMHGRRGRNTDSGAWARHESEVFSAHQDFHVQNRGVDFLAGGVKAQRRKA
jgi:hypothetical protein